LPRGPRVSSYATGHPHGRLTHSEAYLLRTTAAWLTSSWWTAQALQGQPEENSHRLRHTTTRPRITGNGQGSVADHVPRCCITLGGEASRRTEGLTSSAQGRAASQQQLSVPHLWPDAPVKDRALRPHPDASLVMRSVVSTAQSRCIS